MPRNVAWQTSVVAVFVLLPSAVARSAGPRRECRSVCPSTVVRMPADVSETGRMLNRLSSAELVELQRDPRVTGKRVVFEFVLMRHDLDLETRREALEQLATLNGRDRVAELFRTMYTHDRGAKPNEAVLAGLGRLLLTLDRDLMKKNWSSMRSLARYGRRVPTRKYGWAAYAAVGETNRLQIDSTGSREQYFLMGIPLVADANRRRELQPQVETILARASAPALRAAALDALAACDGSPKTIQRLLAEAKRELDAVRDPSLALEGEKFVVAEVRARAIVDAALRGLRRVPPDDFPVELTPEYVDVLAAVAETRPPRNRTEEWFRESLEQAAAIVDRLAATENASTDEIASLRRSLDALDVPRVEIVSIRHAKRFEPTRIDVTAGRPIELLFKNDDDLPQRLVIASVEPDVAAVEADREPLLTSGVVPPRRSQSFLVEFPEEPAEYEVVSLVGEGWRMGRGLLRTVAAASE